MSYKSVALLKDIKPAAGELFEQQGFEVVNFPKSVSVPQLTDLAYQNRALGVRSGPKLPAEVFIGGNLDAVGVFGIGTNHIDLDAAGSKGVAVFNSLHENTRSVAEHVIGGVFDLMKRTSEHSSSLKTFGIWTKTDSETYEIRGKTIGIVGYGAVGSQVSVLAEAIGMSVKYFDPDPKFPPYGKAERVGSLDELLAESDVVTLHVPGIPATKNMIDANTLKLMKQGSYLINTARGDVVDYDAVGEALDSGYLGGVAVDVFTDEEYTEPANYGDDFDHPLRRKSKATLTPHTAGSTEEAQSGIASSTAKKLISYLNTGNSAGSVNMPELVLGPVPVGQTRILHVHDNVPGVEAALLARIAEEKLNLASNVLNTRRALGYAAVHVEGEVSDELIEDFRKTEHTIRVRTIG